MKIIALLFFVISLTYAHGEELLGAVEQIDITPRKGTPVAGFGGGKRRLIPWDIFSRYKYATYFKPNQGQLDPLRAKVFLLEQNKKKLLFVSLDVVGTISHFKTHLLNNIQELGFDETNVFVTSTHTHSGSGTLTFNKLWQIMATDRFNKKIYGRFIARLVTAVKRANENLVPVQLFGHKFEVDGIQRNRALKNGQFDSTANALFMKRIEDNEWLGGMVNFALHGTALGQDNLKFSADVLGSIERSIEEKLEKINANKTKTSILFLNGALGDVGPKYSGLEGMEVIGRVFSDRLIEELDHFEVIDSKWSVSSKMVYLGRPGISIYNCSKKNFLGKLIKWTRFLKKSRLSLAKSLPKREKINLIQLGPILMMTWPGEPITSLGKELKDMAKSKSKYSWVVSLTDNHLAYFVTENEEKLATKEACNSFYSSRASSRMISGFQSLIDELNSAHE